MISLGLDPSLTGFGWCVHDSEAEGPARVIARGRFATSPRDIFVQRYIDLRGHVDRLLLEYPQVEAVGVESPPFGEQYSEGLYALFLYVNEAIYTRRKDVVYFDPGTVKMLAKEDPSIRKGKMFKADMVAAAKVDTGIKGRFNHNEADAYHIGRFAARFFLFVNGSLKEADLTPAEFRAFARTHTFVRGRRKGETVQYGAAFKEGQRWYRFSTLERK
jgi:Holliday junction resolvasome RuvABC endonuclease subunit